LSDLANSCEYLTNEKSCLAVLESEKAQAARQARCKNDEKTTCCYLCMVVLDCDTPCKFLGTSENVPLKIEREKAPIEAPVTDEQKPLEEKTDNAPITHCSGCEVEMAQTRTKFIINGWKGLPQKSTSGDSGKLGEQELPVIVYLCPKCGKIDFRAEEKQNKN